MILRKRAADIVGRWGVDNKKCEDFSVIIGECGKAFDGREVLVFLALIFLY
jgi:hypothetical protein